MKKFLLLSMLFILVITTVFINFSVYAATVAVPEKMKAVWLWGATVREMGKDGITTVINDLKNYGFTDIFLLVKGQSGIVGYQSKIALSTVKSEGDQLKDLITEAHKNKIRLHAWYVVNGDDAWSTKHPEDQMVHLTKGPVSGKISPLAPRYRKYIQGLVKEVINNYDVDGVHLDYIRYGHAVYSFDKYTLDEAKKRRIDIEKVKSILNQTFYDPKDSTIVMKAYKNGDPAIVAWEKLRRDIIVGFAKNIKKVVKSAKRPLYFSAALMPEGAYDPVFADVHYAQNYQDAGTLYDFVAPMAYWGSFGQSPEWVGNTVTKQGAVFLKKVPVLAGLQAFGVSGNKELEAAEATAQANGAIGVIYFRYGTFAFATIRVNNSADGKTLVSFELENQSESIIDNIEIDFNGTGLIPKAIVEVPANVTSQVINNSIALTADKMLSFGKTITFSVEVGKDPAVKDASPMPLIKMSFQKKTFIPICAMRK